MKRTSSLRLSIAELSITTPTRSLHVRQVELEATTSILETELRRSLAGDDAQLALPLPATRRPRSR